MKRIRIFTLLAMLIFISTAFGQKTDNLTFEGYLKNQPKYFLPDQPYTIKYVVSEWFKEQLNNNTLSLEIKGYTEGKGYTVFFISDDPELKQEVLEQINTTTRAAEFKAVVKATSNAKILIVNANNELVYDFRIKPHLQMSRSEGLGVKTTKKEAEAQNKETINKKSDYLKKAYVKEIIKEYQDTLNTLFGKYNKPEKFRTFKVDAKKFIYDDFNGAAEKFKSSCSTPIIDQNGVSEAIATWEKCILDYQPGKKTRICDLNIDALYLNLMQAYLVHEDYENAKKYWEKCLEIKGNRTAEGYVKRFYEVQVNNLDYYPISKAKYSPKSLISAVSKQNQSLFFNLFLSYYFTSICREMSVIQEYFPLNVPLLNSMEATHNYDDYRIETLKVKYGLNGAPLSAMYSLSEEQRQLKNVEYAFKYDGNKLQSVVQNNVLKYKLKYEGEIIKEICINPGKEKEMIYIMDYNNPEKIMITARFKKDGKYVDSKRPYYVKFHENGAIKAYYIDVYTMKEFLYDSKGNWTGIMGVNESTGNEFAKNFTIELDENGICTKRLFSDDIKVERKLSYIE